MSDRTCAECGERIHYGLFCNNHCGNINYQRWLRLEARDSADRCRCKQCRLMPHDDDDMTLPCEGDQ